MAWARLSKIPQEMWEGLQPLPLSFVLYSKGKQWLNLPAVLDLFIIVEHNRV